MRPTEEMVNSAQAENKTIFNHISNDWVRVKNHCRTTVNKEFTENEPGDQFKLNLLVSEHTPIRILEFDWTWPKIPYWVSTEWARHHFEKYITSQRSDRTNDTVPRGSKPQEAPVNYDGFANIQNLIDSWRKRLCFQATKEARELAVDFKKELRSDYYNESIVLVPNCIYRFGCPEFTGNCNFFQTYLDYCFKQGYCLKDLTDIKTRYKLYDQYLFQEKS